MLDGLHKGTYLEIGAGWPEHISNTALLELQFGWHGVSLDYEDWWSHPDLVDADRLQLHHSVDDSIKDYQLYLYK